MPLAFKRKKNFMLDIYDNIKKKLSTGEHKKPNYNG
jgi:hypothetical protein